jgi:hypothetical protein
MIIQYIEDIDQAIIEKYNFSRMAKLLDIFYKGNNLVVQIMNHLTKSHLIQSHLMKSYLIENHLIKNDYQKINHHLLY